MQLSKLLALPAVDHNSIVRRLRADVEYAPTERVLLSDDLGCATLYAKYSGRYRYYYLRKTFRGVTSVVYVGSEHLLQDARLFSRKLSFAKSALIDKLRA
jgi:hypothetical protein